MLRLFLYCHFSSTQGRIPIHVFQRWAQKYLKPVYVVGSKSFWPDQLFKVTEMKQRCYFSMQSPCISTQM
jgi:hypothetical protein